jgi:hypothetical protein
LPDVCLDKDFDLLFIDKNLLYRLSASCNYSSNEWEVVIKNFKSIFNIYTENINCKCGGECNIIKK